MISMIRAFILLTLITCSSENKSFLHGSIDCNDISKALHCLTTNQCADALSLDNELWILIIEAYQVSDRDLINLMLTNSRFKEIAYEVMNIRLKKRLPAQDYNAIVLNAGHETIARFFTHLTENFYHKSITPTILKKFDNNQIIADFRTPNRLISWSDDRKIMIWNASQDQPIKTLEGHQEKIRSVFLDPNNANKLMSLDKSGTFKLWDLNKEPSQIETFKIEGFANISSPKIHPLNPNLLFFKTWPKQLSIVDMSNNFHVKTIYDSSNEYKDIYGFEFDPNHKDRIFIKFNYGGFEAIEINQSSTTQTIIKSNLIDNHFMIDPSHPERLFTWTYNGTIKLWNLKDKPSQLKTFVNHLSDPILEIKVDPLDLNRLISLNHNNTIKIWDIEKGVATHTLVGHQGHIKDAFVDPNDPTKLISLSLDETIKIWDLKTGSLIKTLHHNEYPQGVIIDPKDPNILISWGGSSIKIWNKESGALLNTLEDSDRLFDGVIFDANNPYRLLAWDDESILTWDYWKATKTHVIQNRSKP